MGENSQGDNKNMKRMWEEQLPHFQLELAVNQNICQRNMSVGASSSVALWNQKWAISELSGVVFLYNIS